MDVFIPIRFHEIVDEIARFVDLPQREVEDRIWREALEFGSNVRNDVAQFGVTPHEYNERMERLYQQGNGFIFETLVSWTTEGRQKWVRHTLERIRLFQTRTERSSPQILMLGDGAGSDSLFLAKNGLRPHYFDFPGSRTYQFALQRFRQRGLLDGQIHLVENYADCMMGKYDVVVCFEVLEHVPDPAKTIRDIGRMLCPNGIALVTESFGSVRKDLPTHLRANLRFAGRTPFVFLKNGMRLSWYSTDPVYKPLEFTKVQCVTAEMYLQLLEDGRLVKDLMRATLKPLVRSVQRWAAN